MVKLFFRVGQTPPKMFLKIGQKVFCVNGEALSRPVMLQVDCRFLFEARARYVAVTQ